MKERFDIAVIGSGAAGIAAAVSAARAGCRTLLLDKNAAAGGTGGFSGLTTLCGLYDDAGNYLNDGFAREFAEALVECGAPGTVPASFKMSSQRAETVPGAPLKMGRVWVLPYRPEQFRAVAARFLTGTPELQTRWNTPLADVVVQDQEIVSLNGLEVGAVIDCSGSAEVALAVGAECLATDETTQASAVIFPLRHVTREMNSPAAAAQVLLPLARAGFPPLNFQPEPEPGCFTVKFAGPPEQVPAMIAFLQKHISGFEHCSTLLKSFTIARRAGKMIVGKYLLTAADVLSGKSFSDAVARCAWPVEQWGRDGIAQFRYLPPGQHYEIPARSLRAASIKNLFMAGKTISADVDAIASARVMGCCLATGAAAGVLAADYLKSTSTA
ncbi:MAG TPA: FAD-dependent oxidoreductase [Candidatus Paceibacterota bacterium]|nr:FAD-dependent oxidoreductase [Candidatus Paceibacterota bacterium]